jgi:hypothetical protein
MKCVKGLAKEEKDRKGIAPKMSGGRKAQPDDSSFYLCTCNTKATSTPGMLRSVEFIYVVYHITERVQEALPAPNFYLKYRIFPLLLLVLGRPTSDLPH